MYEELQIIKLLNLLMFGSVAAIVASTTFGLIVKFLGRGNVREQIRTIEKEPLALAVWLGLSRFSVFFLYAYIFTRF